ncbi:MAG: M48 family metallopeptidase [Desulfomonile tiedjei]|uniref:M48 family metallopeptidase n=1 Tax=Desulfomonile tiedjei TaxID=2358 RepID=A0A9D6V6V3_9BACT|nr:M48 family metallopeptidase [Desulfomonile tiedjei]
MSTESHQIRVSGLVVEVVRKKIKNLHLGVYPPGGRVRVAVPLHLSDEAVRLAIITRLAWIKRQKAKFGGQERQSEREFVSGESHYFQGRRYRLNMVYQKGRARVVLRNKSAIDLYVREGSDTSQRERVFLKWCREQLKSMIPPLIEKWESIIDVKVADWGVKQMKTKWGTCTIKARRIWLNLELVKKPLQCLEYVIVHEMVHLLERHHNDRFAALMDNFMPQWRLHREELNRTALKHETWDY